MFVAVCQRFWAHLKFIFSLTLSCEVHSNLMFKIAAISFTSMGITCGFWMVQNKKNSAKLLFFFFCSWFWITARLQLWNENIRQRCVSVSYTCTLVLQQGKGKDLTFMSLFCGLYILSWCHVKGVFQTVNSRQLRSLTWGQIWPWYQTPKVIV